jgi:hypothetical protein
MTSGMRAGGRFLFRFREGNGVANEIVAHALPNQQNTNVKKAIIVGLLAIVLSGMAALYTFRNRPILLHAFAETNCACGDYHSEVTGFVIRNPFRDRSPEQAATAFLDHVLSGRCSRDISEEVCAYALNAHAAPQWKLMMRHDEREQTSLFFKRPRGVQKRTRP